VQQLLDAQAAVDAADGEGKTALHWEAMGGHTAVVEQLLNAQASIDAADEQG
jgi:ankyrin repeat protein